MLVYNIPGLVEADSEKIARNKLMLATAIRELPRAKFCGLFVFRGGSGARIQGEDVSALQALLTYCAIDTHEAHTAFGFVMNNVQRDTEHESDAAWQRLTVEVQDGIVALLAAPQLSRARFPFTMLEALHRSQKNAQAPEWAAMRVSLAALLDPLLARAKPLVHLPPPGRTIALAADVHRAAIDAITAKHDDTMAQIKAQHEQQREALEREITARRDREEALLQQIRDASQPSFWSQLGEAVGVARHVVDLARDVVRRRTE